MINTVLTKVWFTVGPVGPQIYPVIISLVPECVTGIDVLSTILGRIFTLVPCCSVWAIMVGKAK